MEPGPVDHVDFCGKCSIFVSHVDMSPYQKLPTLTTITMHFDAVINQRI